MTLIDCHTHSTNSPDAESSPDAMLRRAAELGLSAYALTDHCEVNRFFSYGHYSDHGDPENTFDFGTTFENSMRDNMRLKEQYKGKLDFINGIELGQAQYDFSLAAEIASDCRLDFVIGSIHQVRGEEDFAFIDHSKNDPAELIRRYYSEIYELCEKGDFDILGHLTYPLRYIEGDFGLRVDMKAVDEIIRESFRVLVRRGKGIEINTSGLRQRYGKTFPDLYYVRMFREEGGEFISVGSDAHCTDDLGKGIADGIKIAQAAGFDRLTYFIDRRPQFIDI